MMKRFRIALLIAVAELATTSASAQRVGPSFACPRPAPADGVAQMICDNADASREELRFEQPYYALRWLLGKASWKDIKLQAIAMNAQLRSTCGFPPADSTDQTMPPDADQCYIREAEKNRDALVTRLTGDPQQEVEQTVEQQIAEQQKLIELGYLPQGTVADGVFGEATRSAIVTWQRVTHQGSADGFMSNADASALLSGASTPTSSDAEPQPSPPTAPSALVQPPTNTEADGTDAAATSQQATLSVEEVIAQADQLAGRNIRVRGSLSCIDEMCSVSQPNGMSSISFNPKGFGSQIRIELLKCGSFSASCGGWIAGVVQRSAFGILELRPSAINLSAASGPGE